MANYAVKGVQGHFLSFKICFTTTFLLTLTFYRNKVHEKFETFELVNPITLREMSQ